MSNKRYISSLNYTIICSLLVHLFAFGAASKGKIDAESWKYWKDPTSDIQCESQQVDMIQQVITALDHHNESTYLFSLFPKTLSRIDAVAAPKGSTISGKEYYWAWHPDACNGLKVNRT